MSRALMTPEAALQALIRAAQALAAHHAADLASRPGAVPEYFEHPLLGLQATYLMVPVPLLNGLARAAASLAAAKAAAKAAPPAALMHARPAALIADDGQDC